MSSANQNSTNTAFVIITSRGPWHLFNSMGDMQKVISMFGEEVIQLKRNENKTEVDVGGQKPADTKKKKTEPSK